MGLILWSKNYDIDSDIIENVKNQIKNNQTLYDPILKYHTTFFSDSDNKPELVLLDYYAKIIKKVTSEVSLFHRSNYIFPFWAQFYTNKSKKFREHDHFSGNEVLSWVHFLTQSSNKCFYFIDSDGNKNYPEQNKGDFIVFPSWALHAVDPPLEDERFIIAGNINLQAIQTQVDDNTSSERYYYKVANERIGLWEISIIKKSNKNKKGFSTI